MVQGREWGTKSARREEKEVGSGTGEEEQWAVGGRDKGIGFRRKGKKGLWVVRHGGGGGWFGDRRGRGCGRWEEEEEGLNKGRKGSGRERVHRHKRATTGGGRIWDRGGVWAVGGRTRMETRSVQGEEGVLAGSRKRWVLGQGRKGWWAVGGRGKRIGFGSKGRKDRWVLHGGGGGGFGEGGRKGFGEGGRWVRRRGEEGVLAVGGGRRRRIVFRIGEAGRWKGTCSQAWGSQDRIGTGGGRGVGGGRKKKKGAWFCTWEEGRWMGMLVGTGEGGPATVGSGWWKRDCGFGIGGGRQSMTGEEGDR